MIRNDDAMNNEQRILLVEELYHQYYPRLDQYCRRYVGYNHAFDPLIEDCIQEVFLELDKEIEILGSQVIHFLSGGSGTQDQMS